jgi:hypothetical protein
MVNVLGETFLIRDRKIRTQGIRFTNDNTLKEFEYIFCILGQSFEYNELLI